MGMMKTMKLKKTSMVSLQLILFLICCLVLLSLSEGFSVGKIQKSSTKISLFGTAPLTIERPASLTALEPASVVQVPSVIPKTVSWKQLVPAMWENPRGLDLRFQWKAGEEAYLVAERCLEQIEKRHERPLDSRRSLQEQLAESIQVFTDFCTSYLTHADEFTARIVATRGPASTKCPVFHLDHVPVRFIQSMAGPGCEWVDSEDVEWENVNNLSGEELPASERNKRLISPQAKIHHAAEGEAVMLLGNRWSELAYEEYSDLDPSVHKSPDKIMPWEGRVLLTMDVLTPE